MARKTIFIYCFNTICRWNYLSLLIILSQYLAVEFVVNTQSMSTTFTGKMCCGMSRILSHLVVELLFRFFDSISSNKIRQSKSRDFVRLLMHPPLFQDLKIVGFVRGCNRHLTHILPDGREANPLGLIRGG
jgi:hypothetical protein